MSPAAFEWRLTARLPLTLLAALAMLVPSAAEASDKVANKLRGTVVLSTMPFPTAFKSDRAFIKKMKRVDTKRFVYGTEDKIPVEFMAFFARSYTVTEFTVTIFDVTERREMIKTFPVYPQQRKTRILAASMRIDIDTFEEEHTFLMVVQPTYGGPVIAETKFAVKAGKDGPRKKKQEALP